MSLKTLDIPGIGHVKLYKRRGNRSIKLSVSPAGEVHISMPYWAPYAAGISFAKSKSRWIDEQRTKAQRPIFHGQPVGKNHLLYFKSDPLAGKIRTRLAGEQAVVILPAGTDPLSPTAQSAAQTVSYRVLRREAEDHLPKRLSSLAARYGLNYSSVTIRRLKSRWGSCTQSNDITLNLFLMQLPWELIDYVIIHELAHTKFKHHGADFWNEMERYLPNAKQLKKQMRQFQPIIS